MDLFCDDTTRDVFNQIDIMQLTFKKIEFNLEKKIHRKGHVFKTPLENIILVKTCAKKSDFSIRHGTKDILISSYVQQ